MKKILKIFVVTLLIILYFIMAIDTWGNIPKAQDDNQKINEAIDEAIDSHLADSNAHIDTGESVNAHKSATIIDHPAGSVVNDKVPPGELNQSKLSNTELQVYTAFESLDGWLGALSGVSNSLLSVLMQTGTTINTQRKITAEPGGIGSINSYSDDTFFQTAIKLSSSADILCYFMTGGFEDDDSDSGFGFKIEDGSLYAIVVKAVTSSRTEFTTEITGITSTNLNIYKAFLDSSESKIYFYVNGVLKHTESTNLPTATTPSLFFYSIENKATSNKAMAAAYLLYSREI